MAWVFESSGELFGINFVHIRIIVPAVLRLLRIPHSDHEWIRHVGSTFYIACLWLAIWYVFVSVCSCSLCCVAQCCICMILHVLPGVFLILHVRAGGPKGGEPKGYNARKSQDFKGSHRWDFRRHDMPRCATSWCLRCWHQFDFWIILSWAGPWYLVSTMLAAAADAGRILNNGEWYHKHSHNVTTTNPGNPGNVGVERTSKERWLYLLLCYLNWFVKTKALVKRSCHCGLNILSSLSS